MRPALAFRKQADRVRADERASQIKEPVERSKRPGGQEIDSMRRHRGDAATANHHIGGRNARRLPQKSSLARVRLDQFDRRHAEDCQHQSGKPGTAAEIDQAFGSAGDERA